jgi:hypothetical protein
MNKRDRFLVIGGVSSALLFAGQELLRPFLEPFVRYLVMFFLTKVLTDAIYYYLAPRRRIWQYPEDYLIHEVLSLLAYGVTLCIGQRYLIAYGFLRFAVLESLVDSFLPPLFMCLSVRWTQEEKDDRSYRPGRRLAGQ